MKVRVSSRTIFRWIHIVLAIPIYGYIYSPFEKLPQYAPPTRHVFFPLMVLTGLWMWKGHVLRRLMSRFFAYSAPSRESKMGAWNPPLH
jgi:hypothetical protein